MLRHIENVAYKHNLLSAVRIHSAFHVYLLKPSKENWLFHHASFLAEFFQGHPIAQPLTIQQQRYTIKKRKIYLATTSSMGKITTENSKWIYWACKEALVALPLGQVSAQYGNKIICKGVLELVVMNSLNSSTEWMIKIIPMSFFFDHTCTLSSPSILCFPCFGFLCSWTEAPRSC